MITKYTKEQLMKFSNEEIPEMTKNRAIDFHLNNKHWTQLCVNDLQSFDSINDCFYTRTGIQVRLNDIDFVEVLL